MPSASDNRADGASAPQHPIPPVFTIRVNTIRAPGRPPKNPSASVQQRLDSSCFLRLLIRICKAVRVGDNSHLISRRARVLIIYDKEADLDTVLEVSKFFALFDDHSLISSYYGDSRPCITPDCRLQTVPQSGVKWPTLEDYVNDDDEHKSHLRAEWKKREASRALLRVYQPPCELFRVIHVLKNDYDKCSPNFKQAVVDLPLPQLPKEPVAIRGRIQCATQVAADERKHNSGRGSNGRQERAARYLRRRK